ncbi:MAG: right-handed parallel beta-helix repeat-containing protein [Candidatus Thorarchaeota archaeon]|nr:right-handed parallel beta-helix repeat-containing protein [Candidatus Thorarchaeota archaeon]
MDVFRLLVVIAASLVLACSPGAIALQSLGCPSNTVAMTHHAAQHTSSLMLSIDDDTDLASFPGSGTAEDPYVISGIIIAGSDLGISVANTRRHFIIRNCSMSTIQTSVRFSNVTNGVVEACNLTGSTGVAIQLSQNCSVTRNRIVECTYGIQIGYSYQCIVKYNSISRSGFGIVLETASEITVHSNDVFANQRGLYAADTSHDNTFFLNSIGWNGESLLTHDDAYDDGESNQWDNGTVGNEWEDHDGSDDYWIRGDANARDRFPNRLVDDTPPVVTLFPDDIVVEEGGPNVQLQWRGSDRFPREYVILFDLEPCLREPWSGETVTFIVSESVIGEHNVTVMFLDFAYNAGSHSIRVTILPRLFGSGTVLVLHACIMSALSVLGLVVLVKLLGGT